MSVGDRLARGDQSAQFSTSAGLSNFTNDLIFNPQIVAEKYGLTEEEVAAYQDKRLSGAKLPDLQTKQEQVEKAQEEQQDLIDAVRLGFKVSDKRISNLEVVKPAEKKYQDLEYTPLKPILDRLLVMRQDLKEDEELLSDGSVRNKKTGFYISAEYRQHNQTGIVLAAGDFAVVGGQRIPMEEIVRPGDRVTFGEYNVEVFPMDPEQIQVMCDRLKVNYMADIDGLGLRIVRVLDVRGVETPINESQAEEVPNV